MRKFLSSLALVLFASSAYGVATQLPVGVPQKSFDAISLSAPAGVSSEWSLIFGTGKVPVITWQTIYSAAPTTITVLLECSTDGSAWSTCDTSTNNAGEIRTIIGSYKFIRANNTAVSGGAGKTITVFFVYSTGASGGSFTGGTLTSPLTLAADSCLTWGVGDSAICNDAANTLAQRNSTNAQTFRIYNTFTDASNYERLVLGFAASARFDVRVENAGTGAARDLYIGTAGSSAITIYTNNLTRWTYETDGDYVPTGTDNVDVGASFAPVKSAFVARSMQGSKSKALVDATPTEFVRVAIPQTMGSNYAAGQLIYTVYARDATTGTQTLHGIAEWSCINNAGTESCSTIIESQKTAAVVTGGTLTCALTHVTGLTDLIGIQANCDTSLTATGLTIEWRLDMPHPNTITPQ